MSITGRTFCWSLAGDDFSRERAMLFLVGASEKMESVSDSVWTESISTSFRVGCSAFLSHALMSAWQRVSIVARSSDMTPSTSFLCSLLHLPFDLSRCSITAVLRLFISTSFSLPSLAARARLSLQSLSGGGGEALFPPSFVPVGGSVFFPRRRDGRECGGLRSRAGWRA